MANVVCSNAMLTCSFGSIPTSFQPAQCQNVVARGIVANAMDATPMNILPFGMCSCPANPMVASATMAAFGVLTPMPCVPLTSGIWLTSKMNVLVNHAPILTSDARLMCIYGGIIQCTTTPAMHVQL